MAETYLNEPLFSSIATDPIRNFKFLVDIELNNTTGTIPHAGNGHNTTLASLGFTSVSGLSITTESIPYRQGGYNTTVHQIPGQTTFTPITLQRGMLLGTSQPWEWMKMLFSVIAGKGNGDTAYTFRSTVDISVLHHPETVVVPNGSTVVQRFRVYNAWISSLSFSDLNAGDNNLVVEQMTLVHEGFDMKLANPSQPDHGMTSAPGFSV